MLCYQEIGLYGPTRVLVGNKYVQNSLAVAGKPRDAAVNFDLCIRSVQAIFVSFDDGKSYNGVKAHYATLVQMYTVEIRTDTLIHTFHVIKNSQRLNLRQACATPPPATGHVTSSST